MKLAFAFFALLLSAQSYAQTFTTVDVASGFHVTNSNTVSVKLNGSRYIRNLIVRAQGWDSASVVEVMVNGEIKGTLYAPGRDPSYVVTIAEPASSIEFRHREGGTMQILDVLATVSDLDTTNEPVDRGINGGSDQVETLAFKVIHIVERLQAYATLDEETTYLIPLKKLAGRVHVMSAAHGNLSYKTRRALVVLQQQIQFSEPYIDASLEKNAMFDLGVELLVVKETIRDLLD